VGGLYSPQVVSRVARVRPTVTRRKDPGRGLRDSGRADCAATYDDANRSPEFGSSYSSTVRYRARTLRRRPRRASTSFTPTATRPDTSFSTRGSGQVDFYDEGSRWTGYGAGDLASGEVQRFDADGRRHESTTLPIPPDGGRWASPRIFRAGRRGVASRRPRRRRSAVRWRRRLPHGRRRAHPGDVTS